MAEEIINRVAKSGLITIDLGDYAPEGEVIEFDLKDWLYQGLILKEKEFRVQVKEHDWSRYRDKIVALHCSSDAIVPVWAYMTLSTKMKPYCREVLFGNREAVLNRLFERNLHKGITPGDFKDQKVVIKGCGDVEVPAGAFVTLTAMLMPHVQVMMYGEPCSTVPVYKRPRK